MTYDNEDIWEETLLFQKQNEKVDGKLVIHVEDEDDDVQFKIYAEGSSVGLELEGGGEDGEDIIEIKVELEKKGEDIDEDFDIPSTKYRTTSIKFDSSVDNAPKAKLFCIDNYNWELHIISDIEDETDYSVYHYNLLVNGKTDDCSVSLVLDDENDEVQEIFQFKQRVMSTFSGKFKFINGVGTSDMRILVAVMAYFRYSTYGIKVTVEGNNPNDYKPILYQKQQDKIDKNEQEISENVEKLFNLFKK